MALSKFKSRYFDTALDLTKFVTTEVALASVVSIVYDTANNKHVLYYLVT